MGTHGPNLALALLLLAPRGDLRANGPDAVHVDSGFAFYSDQQETSIWSPYGRAGAKLGDNVDIEADWGADIITSASVDVVTAATSRMEELRQQVGARATYEAPLAASIEGGYLYSFERDSASHVVQIAASRPFLRKRLDLALRYGLSWNATGILGEPRADWRTSWVHGAEAGATVVANPRTEIELLYSPYLALGYQAGPYRRVPVGGGEDLRGAIWIDEQVPERRLRHALVGRLRRAIASRFATFAEYRFYTDDWGVRGHSIEAEVAAELNHGFAVRLRERASLQGAASFYRARYVDETHYRTRDRRLSPLLASLGGPALTWEARRVGPIERVVARLGVDLLAFRYQEFLAPVPDDPAELSPLGWVLGYVAQAGIEVEP